MAATMLLPTEIRLLSLFYALLLCALMTYDINATPYKHFSTKTPYAWVNPSATLETIDDSLYTLALKELKGMSCAAVHSSAVIRHGARYPGLEDVNEISNIHERLVAAMEPDINPELYNWVNQFPSNNNKALSHLGEEEQEDLGQRFAKKLTTLFVEEDMSNFRFIVSSQERTKQSASAFYEGFANIIHTEEEIEDEFDSEVNDELMRFFSLCANYVFSVENNKTAHKEHHAFLTSEKVLAIKKKIETKLDIKEDIITTANVRLIYLVCGYETALFKSSPWCSLLDESDMDILEYLGDLKHYYKNGYGHNITWQQSCPLLSEIFGAMDETIVEIESTDDDEEVDGFIVGQFAFGHAETLGPLYAALGLFNDSEPLRADNYDDHKQRKFRTSNILPFSANIMFVLYECVPEEFGEDEEIDEADYYVKLLVNEQPELIPGCQELHCPYNVVRQRYSDFIDKCDFKEICKRKVVKDEL